MKHRTHNGRLVLQHHTIDDLRPVLEDMATWSMVASVIPGRIRHATGRRHKLMITASVETPTGLKLLAKGRTGTVQEVFVVTADRASFRKHLRRRG